VTVSVLSRLFNSKPLIDESAAQWLFDCYAWALQQFDAQLFRDKTVLVLPNDRFFPGRVDSVEGLASLIFDRVKEYAAVSHWPTQLVDDRQCSAPQQAHLLISGSIRDGRGTMAEQGEASQRLVVPYDPALVNNPEAMIASLSHQVAHYMAGLAESPPPGGEPSWAQATEVLAVFLGFGLMFANSAFNVRIQSCGSCGGPAADRQSFLSQYDTTYALAIFCVLKGIPNREVVPHLKASLRGFYKKAVKEVSANEAALARLRQIS